MYVCKVVLFVDDISKQKIWGSKHSGATFLPPKGWGSVLRQYNESQNYFLKFKHTMLRVSKGVDHPLYIFILLMSIILNPVFLMNPMWNMIIFLKIKTNPDNIFMFYPPGSNENGLGIKLHLWTYVVLGKHRHAQVHKSHPSMLLCTS